MLAINKEWDWTDNAFEFNSFAAGGNYSRPHSLAAVGDYRRRIYAIYVGGT